MMYRTKHNGRSLTKTMPWSQWSQSRYPSLIWCQWLPIVYKMRTSSFSIFESGCQQFSFCCKIIFLGYIFTEIELKKQLLFIQLTS